MSGSILRHTLSRMLAPAARHLTRHRPRILFYHRFGEGTRSLSPEVFETQLRYLKTQFHPVSLTRVLESQASGDPLPPRSVVVTVDDGYQDFLWYAYPLLQQYAVPATLYVVSQFAAGHLWLWFDRIRYVCEHCELPEVTLETEHGNLELAFDTPRLREQAWDRLATYALGLSMDAREGVIDRFSRSAQVVVPVQAPVRFAAMSFAQLRSLDPGLVEIGAHTRTHATLSGCTEAQLHSEIQGSREELERALDRPVLHFCYPNGQSGDFGATAIRAVEAAHFRSATISFGGFTTQDFHPLLLPRIAASFDLREFRRNLDGITELNDRVKDRSICAAIR